MKLIKPHETALLYIIPITYLTISIFIIDVNLTNTSYSRILEASLILLVLVLIRERLIMVRINRKNLLRIVPINIPVSIFRVIMVLLFFVISWILKGESLGVVIIFSGAVLNLVLPKPYTEGHFMSETEYFHKSKIFRFSEINDLKVTNAGDVVFKFKGYEERLAYLSRANKLKVYKYLEGKL